MFSSPYLSYFLPMLNRAIGVAMGSSLLLCAWPLKLLLRWEWLFDRRWACRIGSEKKLKQPVKGRPWLRQRREQLKDTMGAAVMFGLRKKGTTVGLLLCGGDGCVWVWEEKLIGKMLGEQWRSVEVCFGAEGKENGDGCGKRNGDGEESLEVLYGFGPKRGEGRRLLSSVGKESERLGKEGES